MAPQVTVAEVRGGTDLEAVRDLCRAFRNAQCMLYAHEIDMVEAQYGEAAFEEILSTLPERHAPPGGVILLARVSGAPAGCVMLTRIDDATCEMKRMFVDPAFRRKGVGRALATVVIDAARKRGFSRMRLDTGPLQHAAVALYRALGFRDRDPYEEDGPKWPNKVFMDLDLRNPTPGEV